MSHNHHRTIIFAHARSGSTSLVRSLNLHPDLNFAEEPFHPKYGEWNPGERSYIETVVDVPTLDIALGEIFAKHNGMKVLEYQLLEKIYSDLLLRNEYKVICLRRRNALQTVVSGMIATRTGVWHISNLNPDSKKSYESMEPLSLDEIHKRLDYHHEMQLFYRKVISGKSDNLKMFIDYEDLYTENLEQNRDQLKRIFEFVGLSMPETPEINSYLNPASAQILNADVYRMIPNYAEIEARFGCDHNGWLINRA